MTTELVKPSKAIKGATNAVRATQDALDRAREIYLAQINRAEHDYYERVKRATAELITAGPETDRAAEVNPQDGQQSPAATPPA